MFMTLNTKVILNASAKAAFMKKLSTLLWFMVDKISGIAISMAMQRDWFLRKSKMVLVSPALNLFGLIGFAGVRVIVFFVFIIK